MGSLLDDGGGALTGIVLAALGAVLLLGAVGAFLLRRRRSEDPPAAGTGRHARLVVSDAAIVDGRRRLVLVRRDNVEHLLLIGGPSDIVVESNIVRQRAAGVAAGPRPAMARQSAPQAARPAAAAGFASAAPEPRRPGEVDRAAQERLPAASPPEPRRSADDEAAAQERLRSASTALALRQAVAQPGPAGQPAGKRQSGDAASPASTAVAGLAAGLAALTAAAGSRSRTQAPEDGDAKPAGPVVDTTGTQGRPAPEKPDQATPSAHSVSENHAESGEGEGDELVRAVFGRRDAPQVSAPAAGTAERPEAGAAAQQPAESTAAGRSGADEAAALSRRSVEADFAFLDGGDEDRSGSSNGAAPAGPVGGPEDSHAGRGEPTQIRAEAGARSSTSDQDEPDPAAIPTGEGVANQAAAKEPVETESPPQQAPPRPAEPAATAEPALAQDDGGPAGGVSDPAVAERSAPAADEAMPIEAPAPRPGGEGALAVQPAASTPQDTNRHEEPAGASNAAPAVASEEQARPQVPPAHPGNERSGFDVLPVSAAAPRLDGAAAPLSGFRPGRGTTLGDLAERLEEVLIQKAASDPSSNPGAGIAVGAEAMPPNPAPPQRDEPARTLRDSDFQPDQRPLALVPERDEAAIIDFAARRKGSDDSLEEEMARLLGELTRDTNRR